MKPILLCLSLIFLFSSCSKDNDTLQNEDATQNENPAQSEYPTQSEDSTKTALKAHVWLLDSIERFHNGVVVDSLIEGSPKIEMWYTDDKLYFNIPGGPQNDEFNYEVADGNKLYRWLEGNPKNEYFIVQQLTDNLFVLSTHDEEYLDYEYYSPKQ